MCMSSLTAFFIHQPSTKQADCTDYINDGVYGAFNCIMFDHQIVHPYPLTLSGQPQTARPPFPPPPNVHMPVDLPVQLGYQVVEKASVWGPTCDSIDCVREVVKLPKGMAVGDWIGWGEMGAYTLCASSTFNGYVLFLSSCHGVSRAPLSCFSRIGVRWAYMVLPVD